MASELSKTYDPAAVQTEVAAVWDAERCFHAEATDPGEPYSIVIPPPNVTAALHLGHALNNTIQDILIRRARMQGKNAVWLPGTDHAGIATQTVVEKRVMKEEGKSRTDFAKRGEAGRIEFVGKIQAWKDEYEKVILGQLKSMGCSCDFERTAFTMDEPRAKAVGEAFFQLFKAGLIYRGKRLVNWDPVTQTALADDEVENEEIDGFFYYLRYPLCDKDGNSFSPPLAGGVRGRGSAVPGRASLATQDVDAGQFAVDPSPHPLPQGEGEKNYVTVATTRPETMLGDTAVAINPTDPRAAALKGLFVKLPIVNRIIPIIEDDYVVKPVQFGGDPADTKAQLATGFLKVTPAHDPNDYDIGQRHQLPVINVMAPDGSISDKHGWTDGIGDADFLLGKSRETAREEVVEWFRRHGLLGDVKPYRHSVGHSYRSHVPIEPYLSDQWYCRVTDDRLRGAALRAMSQSSPPPLEGGGGGRGSSAGEQSKAELPSREGLSATSRVDSGKLAVDPSPHPLPQGEGEKTQKLTFYPARYAKTYQTWHENIRDWCISRQLWWGHRIPVWSRHFDSFEEYIGDPDSALNKATDWAELLSSHYGDENPAVARMYVLDAEPEKSQEHVPHYGAFTAFYCLRAPEVSSVAGHRIAIEEMIITANFKQDPDVLDTWFSSGLWPMSTLGWFQDMAAEAAKPREATPELAKWNPTTVLTTAREIITLWVSRMVMFNEFFLGQIPFKDVFIHAMIQDGDGRKMSKSLGNGVDPLDIIHSHGADAMRFTLASMCTQTQDVRMPVVKDEATGRNTSTKFDLGRNFSNKIWNAAKFVLAQISSADNGAMDGAQLTFADRWIISRLNRTIAEIDDAIAGYRFDVYAKSLYDFFWRDFCDWYVESAKPQMKDDARKVTTAAVLASVLDASLRLLHPATPFITEKLWWNLNEVVPHRGIPGLLDLPAAKRVIKAAWPKAGAVDEAAEAAYGMVQDVVTQLRNLRSTYKVDQKTTVSVTVRCPAATANAVTQLKAAIELLATAKLVAIGPDVAEPAEATKAQAGPCELFVADMFDAQAEAQRKVKLRETKTKEIAALKGRLGNAGYLAKAPPHLVQQTQDQLAAAEAELASLG